MALQQRLGLLSQWRLGAGRVDPGHPFAAWKIVKSTLVKKGKSDGGTPRLNGVALRKIHRQLGGGWKVVDERRLEKKFKFPDFLKALRFTNRVGKIAEAQGHHPDIFLAYGKVRLQISTHKINGLTESDFILAAKINGLR
jgi:4a-hydroxytetrahydrobiopterin dehydratase